MIITIASWCYIALILYVLGFSTTHYYYKRFEFTKELDVIMVAGMCCMIAISQAMSLFMGLGMVANAILLVVVAGLVWWQRRELVAYSKGIIKAIWKPQYLVVGGILCLVIAYLAAQVPTQYDTELYHAQAIRWIEEYGVVKGLGNLHNRFAYNSAFFCVQAFFSFQELGRSMHSLNGFVVFGMLYYAIMSLSVWRKEAFKISDFLKIGMFVYVFTNSQWLEISSVGSDITAMLGVLYIITKCFEYYEKEERDYKRYAVLSLFAVGVIAIKLSAAFIVFIVLYPAVILLKERRWKEIACYVILGLVIISPYLIRNVIISGYLVYPYASIDLFDVDWKMLASICEFDRQEIIAWGRGLNDYSKYSLGFTEWFPEWLNKLSNLTLTLFVLSIVASSFNISYSMYQAIFKKDYLMPLLVAVTIASYWMWMFSAPLVRYGMVYMLIPIAISLGLSSPYIRKETIYVSTAVLLAVLLYTPMKLMILNIGEPQFNAADYAENAYLAHEFDGFTIYGPDGSDRLGYYPFPNAPYTNWIQKIELRGEDFSDGFRVKEEYQEESFSTYGWEWQVE